MLPFSPGPVPTTDDQFTARLRDGLTQMLRPRAAATIRVASTGATAEHIEAVDIDLDGAQLDPIAAEVPAAGGTPLTVERLGLHGRPVTVRDVPIHLTGELRQVAADWVGDGAGLLWLVPADRGSQRGEGEVEFAAQISDLEQAALRIGGPLVARHGFTLTGVSLQIRSAHRTELAVQMQAQVRRGVLRTTVLAAASVTVDADLVLTISDLSVSSANPLVSMGLAAVRSKVQEWQHKQIDLGTQVIGGLAVREVRLHAEHAQVRIAATVGA